jgi:hypothetical protein
MLSFIAIVVSEAIRRGLEDEGGRHHHASGEDDGLAARRHHRITDEPLDPQHRFGTGVIVREEEDEGLLPGPERPLGSGQDLGRELRIAHRRLDSDPLEAEGVVEA